MAKKSKKVDLKAGSSEESAKPLQFIKFKAGSSTETVDKKSGLSVPETKISVPDANKSIPVAAKSVPDANKSISKKTEAELNEFSVLYKNVERVDPKKRRIVSKEELFEEVDSVDYEPPAYPERLLKEQPWVQRHVLKPNKLQRKLSKMLAQPVKMTKAESMMQKMGWTGGALGKSGDGIVEPIVPNLAYAMDMKGFGQNPPVPPKPKKPVQQKLQKRQKKRHDQECFKVNALRSILDFVRNEKEVELLFDCKLHNGQRKDIHQVVASIRSAVDLEDARARTKSLAQLDLMYKIAAGNRYVLMTQSEGDAPNRYLCLYKEPPAFMYLVTHINLRDNTKNFMEISLPPAHQPYGMYRKPKKCKYGKNLELEKKMEIDETVLWLFEGITDININNISTLSVKEDIKYLESKDTYGADNSGDKLLEGINKQSRRAAYLEKRKQNLSAKIAARRALKAARLEQQKLAVDYNELANDDVKMIKCDEIGADDAELKLSDGLAKDSETSFDDKYKVTDGTSHNRDVDGKDISENDLDVIDDTEIIEDTTNNNETSEHIEVKENDVNTSQEFLCDKSFKYYDDKFTMDVDFEDKRCSFKMATDSSEDISYTDDAKATNSVFHSNNEEHKNKTKDFTSNNSEGSPKSILNINKLYDEYTLRKMSVRRKINKFFADFMAKRNFREFKFLGDFENTEFEVVNEFIKKIWLFLNGDDVDDDHLVKVITEAEFEIALKEDCNGSTVILKVLDEEESMF